MIRSTWPGRSLLYVRRYLIPIAGALLCNLPERWGRNVLAGALRRCPGLWGWSSKSDRRSFTRSSYRQAFPLEDAGDFVSEVLSARARALATGMTYMARTQAGRSSSLVRPLTLPGAGETPCIVTYLHCAIDPAIQLALLAANRGRPFRWVVFPTQPGEPLRWGGERERALFLTGRAIPDWISETLLSVTASSWPIEALRHLRRGGSIFLALDAPLDSRREASASLAIGQARMPISPAIDLLAGASGAQLLLVWAERDIDDTWTLRCERFADTTALAAAASDWIDGNRAFWGGWPYLAWRLKATELRSIVDAENLDGISSRG